MHDTAWQVRNEKSVTSSFENHWEWTLTDDTRSLVTHDTFNSWNGGAILTEPVGNTSAALLQICRSVDTLDKMKTARQSSRVKKRRKSNGPRNHRSTATPQHTQCDRLGIHEHLAPNRSTRSAWSSSNPTGWQARRRKDFRQPLFRVHSFLCGKKKTMSLCPALGNRTQITYRSSRRRRYHKESQWAFLQQAQRCKSVLLCCMILHSKWVS